MILAPIVLAGLLAATLQALSLAWPVTSLAALALFVLRVMLVPACAWAVASAFAGTVMLWGVILVRNDSAEVGTVSALLEGALIGSATALPGLAAFLLLRPSARLHL